MFVISGHVTPCFQESQHSLLLKLIRARDDSRSWSLKRSNINNNNKKMPWQYSKNRCLCHAFVCVSWLVHSLLWLTCFITSSACWLDNMLRNMPGTLCYGSVLRRLTSRRGHWSTGATEQLKEPNNAKGKTSTTELRKDTFGFALVRIGTEKFGGSTARPARACCCENEELFLKNYRRWDTPSDKWISFMSSKLFIFCFLSARGQGTRLLQWLWQC